MALDEGPRDPMVDHLTRESAKSLACDWRTTAPFAMGRVQVERVGFGDIPIVYVQVHCKTADYPSIVPIARQAVYRELEEAGIPSEILCITAGVQQMGIRRKRFTDTNEASPTKGKNKMGYTWRISFEIKDKQMLEYFEWPSYNRGRIPEKSS